MNRRRMLRSAFASAAAATVPRAPSLKPTCATALFRRSQPLAHLTPATRAPGSGRLANRRLRETMPVEAAPGHREDRARVTHLEAFARTLAGIAPWLESGPNSGPESTLRALGTPPSLKPSSLPVSIPPRRTISDSAMTGRPSSTPPFSPSPSSAPRSKPGTARPARHL